jgi:hypothetical protein
MSIFDEIFHRLLNAPRPIYPGLIASTIYEHFRRIGVGEIEGMSIAGNHHQTNECDGVHQLRATLDGTRYRILIAPEDGPSPVFEPLSAAANSNEAAA